ncbi:hypothetical protein [Corynebacterium sp. p3-SID1056]|uniref:hypothetical protein n=1 Tax=Corynebacterium sp. p3-SID1056 TaxID=2916092 RepID=UPI0021A94C96|nr:hypothetical protein [Corynebacterium sp. p3-SID1056]MCT2338533.1 hypothetical protein [Corynebacterium sp. p3-SID1056]
MNGTPIRQLAEPDGLGGDRHAQIAQLRARMAELGGEAAPKVVAGEGVLSVGGGLAQVLPGGGLPRRGVTQVSETPALVVELLDRVAGAGGTIGVIGWPELSYAGMSAGALERVIAVPEPGIEDLAVAGVLAEGLDLVVLRTRTALRLSPVRARPLLARLRKGNAALVAVNVTVPSPALRVSGQIAQFHGIGRGTGRIRGIDVRVRATAKGWPGATATLTLGTAPAREAVAERHLKAVP